ncbi:lysine-specific demethylase ELF6 [Daucus carota subsp. sativus]|uniref:lysine-specific demethylase ELF6 n=1 Tax=Daucus carota subsp. sativus TaxID=79200 RepID=UPI0007EF9F6F|nr:PREDICTED: probable lysine-specific demethylase ELF6 [Daucus carota subsp. sativus]
MRDVKIPNWLSGLPLAPEFRPTDTEFADPIAYISKIEKEASAFGICRVIPPFPRPSKKFVIANLNKSLSKCPELGSDVNFESVKGWGNGGGESKAVFTTRQQELGQSGKRNKGVEKPAPPIYKQVWQSGEVYTLEQFEAKARGFARSQLGMVKNVSALVIETLFWKAASEKPIYVEYANDVPGSGFGEPDGSAQYCRRNSRRRNLRENASENRKEPRGNDTSNDENGCVSDKFNPSSIATGPSNTPDNIARSSRERILGHGNEECSSGQKLSDSPWNLQVIAQSPGSVTRFMPDDIPGVTSPMVYIGMLFSWFAWHVEDHELHSLNFLHTGSPKTWYAVPEDHALTFEEVIRNQAYGGNIDRLAALTLLGEKTTLLSPEVIVASGIPCCRLVQNPGEFVITFPRAYHVGFSHGFNCGEAANFGTPKWLTLAKEAAVRRAAMNHLPMLSHQQLLYLLTMSFISRVPKSLMPGVRSSRLRDRQKEEREILVKKAFVEDIIHENTHLTSLLQKNSSYRAVSWDLEMLPFSPGGSDLVNGVIDMSRPKKSISSETTHKHELSNQDLYLEYVDDADLSSEFQVDSGALPCVACGLLGFPFMSVVQPSKKALEGILHARPTECNSSLLSNRMVDVSVSDTIQNQDTSIKDIISSACERNVTENKEIVTGGQIDLTKRCVQPSTVEDQVQASTLLVQTPTGAFSSVERSQSMCCVEEISLSSSIDNFSHGPNTYFRPRIFCLEHAIQVEELLSGKGGADVLVICHSDFKKIRLHAAAVADEIGKPFSYQEVPLDNASPEDLKLINFAIDDEGQDESKEDWTSTVKINLRHCLKTFKKYPSEELQHALTLKGLCFDKAFNGSFPSFKWKSAKLRSKRRKLNQSESKSSESILMKNDEALESVSDAPFPDKQVKLVHDAPLPDKQVKLVSKSSESMLMKNDEALESVSDAPLPDKQVKLVHDAPLPDKQVKIVSKSSESMLMKNDEALKSVSDAPLPDKQVKLVQDAPLPVKQVKLVHDAPLPDKQVKLVHNAPLPDKQVKLVHDARLPDKQVKLVHYVRRFKSKNSGSGKTFKILEDSQKGLVPVNCADLDKNKHNGVADNISIYENTGRGSSERSVLIPGQQSDMQQKSKCPVERRNVNESPVLSEIKSNLLSAEPVIGNVTSQSGRSKELMMMDEAFGSAIFDSQMQQEIKLVGNSSEKNGNSSAGSPEVPILSTVACQTPDFVQVERENQMIEGLCSQHVNSNLVNAGKSGVLHKLQGSADASTNEVSDPNISQVPDTEVERLNEHIEKPLSVVNIGADSRANLYCEVQTQFASTKVFSDPTISEGSGSDITKIERLSEQIEKPIIEVDIGVKSLNLEGEVQPQFASTKEISVPVLSEPEVSESDISTVERSREQIEKPLVEKNAGDKNCPSLEFELQPEFASAKGSKEDSVTAFVKITPSTNSSPISVKEIQDVPGEDSAADKMDSLGEITPLQEMKEFDRHNSQVQPDSVVKHNRKRKREKELLADGFIRSPCERLRPRACSTALAERSVTKEVLEERPVTKKVLKEKPDTKKVFEEKPAAKKIQESSEHPSRCKNGIKKRKASYNCDVDNCKLSFETKEELRMHKNNKCPHEGCDKTFNSHKNAVLHLRVHDDARPLKCPWEGCTKSFKWAWARTEHIRVHTGEKPYKCKVKGCGREFRFVSDYSRHRRKTGHDKT